jgi:hypothetical protein
VSYCSNCGAIKNETTGVCPNCSVKKKRLLQRLGFIGSGIFILIGALISLNGRQFAAQLACGGSSCNHQITQSSNVGDFFDILGTGLQELALYIILTVLGLSFLLYGLIGLVISIIAAYRKRQSAFFVDGSK